MKSAKQTMRTVGQGAGRQVRPLLLERLAGSGQPLARGGHHSVSDRPQTVCRLSKMISKRCSAPLPRENESVSLAKRLEPNSRKPRNMLLKHVLKYLRTHRIALQISRFTSICEPTRTASVGAAVPLFSRRSISGCMLQCCIDAHWS